MFLGEYQHNLDLKGRVAMPAKFRTGLKKGAIITRGIDECLFVFDKDEWQKLADKLVALPITQANSRAFTRLMLAGAAEAPIDGQGRVLVPDYLRMYAKLDREAVIIGLYSRVEIWDKKVWNKYKYRTEKQSEKIAEQLRELGI
ncbi:MAG: division/cell wall cluster transcriptional repressor MraZ [Candidatus Pacebacteria bacterium]|nr:division/cell wall cluster transcriptional repressor MraZ [Candidatus Paceibacterota bacterium]